MVLAKLAGAAAATAVLAVAGQASAASLTFGFTEDYDPSNAIQSPGTGSINTTGAPNTIILTSGNDWSGSPSDTDFTITAPAAGNVSFDWSFLTEDGPFWDPFGYLLNGNFTQLTNSGDFSQSGTVTFAVVSGDSFGFRQQTLDNQFGAATTTISNFSAPTAVPLETDLAGISVLAGLGYLTYRRRQPQLKLDA